jgi:hypothetical protein
MQKANGSWTKVSAMTVLLCVCLGVAYGWHSVQKEKLTAAQAKSDAVPPGGWERHWHAHLGYAENDLTHVRVSVLEQLRQQKM